MQQLKRFVCILLVLGGCFSAIQAQTHQQLLDSYLSGKLSLWGPYLKAQDQKTLSKSDLAYVVNLDYGYLAWLINEGRTSEAKVRLEMFNKHIAQLEKMGHNAAEIKIYKAGAQAFFWQMNKMKVSYATNSLKLLDEAYKMAPNNTLVLTLKGSATLYNPFGGSKQTALGYLERSVRAMEKEGKVNTWNYCATYQCLIDCYKRMGKREEAKAAAKDLLKKHPNFVYVRDVVAPNL